MPKPGLGQRLIERIRSIKGELYRDDHAKFGIKVTEFALDHRYAPGSVFKWIGDVVVPDYETILRLARDLDASPGWLHYGGDEQFAHGHGPSRGKAARRQGRRTAGSLLLACVMGGVGLLGWPSGSPAMSPLPVDPAGGAQTLLALPSVSARQRGDIMSTLARRLRAWLACPVHPLVPVLA
jgi:hypothetical protein